ncbi:hypothetical protein POTOM_060739 [Populus tomentosa]|uniref:Bromo domain-containing protein n=1 Tax=Populus tomentosa TaxID=118781 RepID=A0A8X7XTJ4_POPTO|nr:hypothetical protein POTOM_060739 [Populus tomentosa]
MLVAVIKRTELEGARSAPSVLDLMIWVKGFERDRHYSCLRLCNCLSLSSCFQLGFDWFGFNLLIAGRTPMGFFSEPVDPEELLITLTLLRIHGFFYINFLYSWYACCRNYVDVSLAFETCDNSFVQKDVLLICSNAMQYNPSDTIYFRQARAMQELAKKDFENLRQDSDDSEPQTKVARRGRPPALGKLKKALERSPIDRVGPEASSDATLATGGDHNNLSNGYNLRKSSSYKYQPGDALVRASYSSENYSSWLSEWENEFPGMGLLASASCLIFHQIVRANLIGYLYPIAIKVFTYLAASVVKAVMKYGKKPFVLDENKRDTYKHPLGSHEPSILSTFEGELKQLVVVRGKKLLVGLSSEHGYARSLARFAADLGPVVWRIASKKIESVLPTGT